MPEQFRDKADIGALENWPPLALSPLAGTILAQIRSPSPHKDILLENINEFGEC